MLNTPAVDSLPARAPYALCLVIGLGGLFIGMTGPLISAFVPPLVRDALGDQRTAIGAVMAIDNVLLLLLVPWAGAASDRATASGRATKASSKARTRPGNRSSQRFVGPAIAQLNERATLSQAQADIEGVAVRPRSDLAVVAQIKLGSGGDIGAGLEAEDR